MSEQTFFQTVEKRAQAEFKDRGSKFIGYVYPIQTIAESKQILQEIKKEHPKAVHHCYAYRLGPSGEQFRVSDDGEPGGTAGRPILGQIDSKQLTHVLVIVVRYFGGTLLGVPGLINAYKSAAAMALQMVPVIQKPIEATYVLQFDYSLMNEVMQLIKQTGCSIVTQEIQLFCLFEIGIPKARLEEVLYKLKELHTITVNPKKG